MSMAGPHARPKTTLLLVGLGPCSRRWGSPGKQLSASSSWSVSLRLPSCR